MNLWIDHAPPRTYQTTLSDDELFLLDFIAVDFPGASFQALTQENYRFHLNVRYTHELSDEQLRMTLDSLIDRGIVLDHKPSPYDETRVYYLTYAGGELWERERRPDWDRFCKMWFRHDTCHIASPSNEVAEKCLDTMLALGILNSENIRRYKANSPNKGGLNTSPLSSGSGFQNFTVLRLEGFNTPCLKTWQRKIWNVFTVVK